MTIGAALKQAREALGLTVQDVSLRTKIRGDYLRALENDQWDALPERTFTRAYLQRYAQELGLEAGPLLSRLDQALPPDPAAVRSEPGRKNTRTPPMPGRALDPRRAPVWPVLLGLLVLGGAGAAFWLFGQRAVGRATPIGAATTPASVEGASALPPSVNLTVTSVPTGARVFLDNRDLGLTPLKSFPVDARERAELRVELSGYRRLRTGLRLVQGRNMRVTLNKTALGSIVDVTSAQARVKAAQQAAGQAATPVPANNQTKPPGGVGASQEVSVTFTGESWTRVTDASGRVVYQGTPPVGSRKAFPAGVTIRAGNGEAVRVSVGGQPAQPMGATGQVVLKRY